MPTYQYKGQYYDLSETDPAKAKAKIQSHLGETAAAPATAITQPETQPYQRQSLTERIMNLPVRAAEWMYEHPKEVAATGIETGAQIAGGLAGGIVGAATAPVTGPVGAFTGAVGGGTAGYTFGRQLTGKLGLREEEPVLTSAGTGLLYEAGGQLLGKGVGKVIEKVSGKGAVKAPTVAELKQAEDEAWGKVADSTATFKDPVPLKDKVDKLLSDKGFNYHPSTFPALNESIKELNAIYDNALKGVPANIHDMRTVRTLLQDLRMSGGAKAKEKELAGRLMDELDDYVIKNGGTDAAAWKEARDTTNQLYRSSDVQNIVKAAEESTRATSKEIRSQFKKILDSNEIKMYNPEQQAIIKQIADGTATEKTLEYVGIMAPKGLTWQKIAGLLGIGTFGGPVGTGAALTAYGIGAGARGAANALAKSRVNMLDELIRGGKMPQTIELPQTTQRLFPAGVNVLANQLQGQQ